MDGNQGSIHAWQISLAELYLQTHFQDDLELVVSSIEAVNLWSSCLSLLASWGVRPVPHAYSGVSLIANCHCICSSLLMVNTMTQRNLRALFGL